MFFDVFDENHNFLFIFVKMGHVEEFTCLSKNPPPFTYVINFSRGSEVAIRDELATRESSAAGM
jgi:hypothetical protein